MKPCLIATDSDLDVLTNIIIRKQETDPVPSFDSPKSIGKGSPKHNHYRSSMKKRHSEQNSPSIQIRLSSNEILRAEQLLPPSPPLKLSYPKFTERKPNFDAPLPPKVQLHFSDSPLRVVALPAPMRKSPESLKAGLLPPVKTKRRSHSTECVIRFPLDSPKEEYEETAWKNRDSFLCVNQVKLLKRETTDTKNSPLTNETIKVKSHTIDNPKERYISVLFYRKVTDEKGLEKESYNFLNDKLPEIAQKRCVVFQRKPALHHNNHKGSEDLDKAGLPYLQKPTLQEPLLPQVKVKKKHSGKMKNASTLTDY